MGEKEGGWGERVRRTNGSQCGITRPARGDAKVQEEKTLWPFFFPSFPSAVVLFVEMPC